MSCWGRNLLVLACIPGVVFSAVLEVRLSDSGKDNVIARCALVSR
jgi:hypothetical protein